MIGFVYNDDFEPLPGGLVDLLGLSYFFQEVLNNDTIEVSNIGRCDFEMID
jgi:hypothetical protein